MCVKQGKAHEILGYAHFQCVFFSELGQ